MKRICLVLIILSIVCPFLVYAKDTIPFWIHIDLRERNLYVMEKNYIKRTFKITIGREDAPSPIGTWKITKKATNWGTGFGSRWMQLSCPWGIYGIHGTNRPNLIGQEASQGCIRLYNSEIEDLYAMIPEGTKVVVDGPKMGFAHWQLKRLQEGNRGTEVFLVQQKLRQKHYYKGKVDGWFGPELQEAVKRFQKDNRLEETGSIYVTEYARLGLLFN